MNNVLNFAGQTKAQVITTLRTEGKLTTDIETLLAPLPEDQIIDGPMEAQILTSLGTTNEGDDSIRKAIQDRIVFTDKPVAAEKVKAFTEFFVMSAERVFRGKRGEQQVETDAIRIKLFTLNEEILEIVKTNRQMRLIFGASEWGKIQNSYEETTDEGLTTGTFPYLRGKAIEVLGDTAEIRKPGTTWNLGESMEQNITGPTTDAAKAKWNAMSNEDKAKFNNDPKKVYVLRTSMDFDLGVNNSLGIIEDLKLSKFRALKETDALRHVLGKNIDFLVQNEALVNKAKGLDISAEALLNQLNKR